MKILILTDNLILLKGMIQIIENKVLEKNHTFKFYFSYNNNDPQELKSLLPSIQPINVREKTDWIINNFDLVFSLHCKQIFPKEIVKNITCINVHPGYNPFNRGWFPQVFSIINKKPCGATIHIMDQQIDHGPIIVQEKVEINSFDTSKTVYDKIIRLELELLDKYLVKIISNDYSSYLPSIEGNYNSKKDFENLCCINLEDKVPFKEAIDRLRALSHDDFDNAFFLDEDGRKIFIKLTLKKSYDK